MIIDTFKQLRRDAIERNLLDLAIVYGWSAIRLSEEHIQEQLQQLELSRAERSWINRVVS